MTYVVQAHGRVELTNDNLQKVFRTNNCVQTHMYIHQTAFSLASPARRESPGTCSEVLKEQCLARLTYG